MPETMFASFSPVCDPNYGKREVEVVNMMYDGEQA
jgi:hypothetical protein